MATVAKKRSKKVTSKAKTPVRAKPKAAKKTVAKKVVPKKSVAKKTVAKKATSTTVRAKLVKQVDKKTSARPAVNRQMQAQATSQAQPKAKVGYFEQYKKDVKTAYSKGYECGWDDAMSLPQRAFCRSAAVVGFKDGVNGRVKKEKFDRKRTEYERKSSVYEGKYQNATVQAR